MVYFNCAKCGTGLKKNQVEAHSYSCKSSVFGCIDCQKDFRGDEYKAHVKCLTESERYESKSSYVSKANKGELKQNAWLEKISSAVEVFRGSPRAKNLLEKMVDFSNVPRKKPKFMNFMRNSFRSFGVTDSLLNEVWSVIENIDNNKPKQQPGQNGHHQNNGAAAKRKEEFSEGRQEENGTKKQKVALEETTATTERESTFDFIQQAKLICQKKGGEEEVTFKKLEKKLFKKYKEYQSNNNDEKNVDDNNNDDDDDDALFKKFQKKFYKKLKKNSNEIKLLVNNNNNNNHDEDSTSEAILEKLKNEDASIQKSKLLVKVIS